MRLDDVKTRLFGNELMYYWHAEAGPIVEDLDPVKDLEHFHDNT